MFNDDGYIIQQYYDVCEKCIHGIKKNDEHYNEYIECELHAKDIDECEYEEY